MHRIIPQAVGIAAESNVHFQLPVSFLIVNMVVEQGQCIRENSIMLTAVVHVHPFAQSKVLSSFRPASSIILEFAVYAIIIIGITISFAGNPRINAISITPSSPIKRAKGSRNDSQ